MMPASPFDVMTAEPAATLRDTLAHALADAIAMRRDRYAFCADCRWAADGACADHQHDSAIADDYEAARKIIASARGTTP